MSVWVWVHACVLWKYDPSDLWELLLCEGPDWNLIAAFLKLLVLGESMVHEGFPVSSAGKESACNAETWVQSLGWEDPRKKGMATHSSILAWGIPWTTQSMGSQRVRPNWATFTHCTLMVHDNQTCKVCTVRQVAAHYWLAGERVKVRTG